MTTMVFNATVLKVHDGDTVDLDVDLGFDVHTHISARLDGCNAAELGTPGGDAAAAWLQQYMPVGSPILVATLGHDKYMRWDCDITYRGIDLVAYMVQLQWVAPWDGKGERPVPPWPRTVDNVPRAQAWATIRVTTRDKRTRADAGRIGSV